MKNYIIIILVILIFASCQNPKTEETKTTKIIRDTIIVRNTFVVTKIKKKSSCNISLPKMNVLYVGIDNPINIKTLGVEGEIRVSISSGTITSVGNENYIVRVRRDSPVTIYVSVDGKMLGSQKFDCKLVPSPTAHFKGLKSGRITKEELLNSNNEIKATLDNFFFDIEFPVTEFTLSVLAGVFIEKISTVGSQITEEQKALLKELRRGSKVYFSNIKVQAPDGSIRELGAVIFTITG